MVKRQKEMVSMTVRLTEHNSLYTSLFLLPLVFSADSLPTFLLCYILMPYFSSFPYTQAVFGAGE